MSVFFNSSSDHIFLKRKLSQQRGSVFILLESSMILLPPFSSSSLTFRLTSKIQLLVNTFSGFLSFLNLKFLLSYLSAVPELCQCSIFPCWTTKCSLLLLLLLSFPYFSFGPRPSPGFLSPRPQLHLGCFLPALPFKRGSWI